MNNKLYDTADIGLATALVCSGFSICNVNRDNPNRVLFVFEQSDKLQTHITAYWNKQLTIPALDIMENLRNLKTRIYAQQ